MDRDTIIRLAREVGLKLFNEGWTSSDNGDAVAEENLERFAALVAAHEREECAKMAEAFHRHGYDFTGDAELHEAIRGRT